jgi:hypothetical protein
LEWRDLFWTELILAEYAAHRSTLRGQSLRAQGCVKAIHSLKLAALRISYALAYMEHMAHVHKIRVDPKEMSANRHKYYGPGHPFTLLYPYLDPEKVYVYYDAYPVMD